MPMSSTKLLISEFQSQYNYTVFIIKANTSIEHRLWQ